MSIFTRMIGFTNFIIHDIIIFVMIIQFLLKRIFIAKQKLPEERQGRDVMDKSVIARRNLIGCVSYVAAAVGCMGIYVTSVAKLPQVYNISVTQLGTLGTLMSVTCMIGSASLVTIRNKIGARGCLYLGGLAMLLQALSIFILKGNLTSLIIELFVCGLVASISAQTVLSEIIAGWYPQKRAEKVAIMLGAAPFGSAFFQFAAGQSLSRMDYFTAVGGMSLITGTLMLLLVHFIIRENHSEGSAEVPQAQLAAEKKSAPVKGLYTAPSFWFLIFATMLAAGNTTYVLNYATMFFTQAGMGMGTAALLLSLMSVSSGLFTLVSGKLFQRFGIGKFLTLLVGAAATANLGMAVFSRTGSMLLIVLIVAGYGMGAMLPTVANLISGTLFGKDDAMNAASKCYAVYAGTNIVLAPTCAAMIDHLGFFAAYCFVALLCSTSLIFYWLAIRSRMNRT